MSPDCLWNYPVSAHTKNSKQPFKTFQNEGSQAAGRCFSIPLDSLLATFRTGAYTSQQRSVSSSVYTDRRGRHALPSSSWHDYPYSSFLNTEGKQWVTHAYVLKLSDDSVLLFAFIILQGIPFHESQIQLVSMQKCSVSYIFNSDCIYSLFPLLQHWFVLTQLYLCLSLKPYISSYLVYLESSPNQHSN